MHFFEVPKITSNSPQIFKIVIFAPYAIKFIKYRLSQTLCFQLQIQMGNGNWNTLSDSHNTIGLYDIWPSIVSNRTSHFCEAILNLDTYHLAKYRLAFCIS